MEKRYSERGWGNERARGEGIQNKTNKKPKIKEKKKNAAAEVEGKLIKGQRRALAGPPG